MQPLERIVDRLSRAWGTVSHLKAVKDTEELRKVRGCLPSCLPATWACRTALNILALFTPPLCWQAVEEVQPERVKLSLRLSQSKPL